jgi:XTP/dITP diphosphohydrolase
MQNAEGQMLDRLSLPNDAVLVLSTRNAGKVTELRAMSGEKPIEVIDLRELEERLELPKDSLGDADESGVTYQLNADIKARSIISAIQNSALTDKERYVVIADDSGLDHESLLWKKGNSTAEGQCCRLEGRPLPGVDTKQFQDACGGPEKMFSVLDTMSGSNRGLKAVTVLAVRLATAPETNRSHFFHGEVSGTLPPNMRGMNGFGYDPFFIPEGRGRTFAEMTQIEKNELSHRRRAIENMFNAVS